MFKTDELWDEVLNEYMLKKLKPLLKRQVYTENGSLFDLYTAPFTMANDRIAPLYEQELLSSEIVRIELDPDRRSGLLTLSGVLAYQSDAAQSIPSIVVSSSILIYSVSIFLLHPMWSNRFPCKKKGRPIASASICTPERGHAGLPVMQDSSIHPDLPSSTTMSSDDIEPKKGARPSMPAESTTSTMKSILWTASPSPKRWRHPKNTDTTKQAKFCGRGLADGEEEMISVLTDDSLSGASISSLVYNILHAPTFTARGE